MDGAVSEQEPERCPSCLGLGAKVERYPVKDQDGYEFMAQRDVPCDDCGGKGYK